MLYLLSPAKSLDYAAPAPEVEPTTPQFAGRAAELIGLLRQKSADDIAALMDLSPALAALNAQRYAAWRPRAGSRNSRPAAFAFDGDVYGGLDARRLAPADLDWECFQICSPLLSKLCSQRLIFNKFIYAVAHTISGWLNNKAIFVVAYKLKHSTGISTGNNGFFRSKGFKSYVPVVFIEWTVVNTHALCIKLQKSFI